MYGHQQKFYTNLRTRLIHLSYKPNKCLCNCCCKPKKKSTSRRRRRRHIFSLTNNKHRKLSNPYQVDIVIFAKKFKLTHFSQYKMKSKRNKFSPFKAI